MVLILPKSILNKKTNSPIFHDQTVFLQLLFGHL